MALQSHQQRKKPLLYSDLFKSSASLEEDTSRISTSSTRSPYSDSEENNDDGDFNTELTRRMTESMLEEEEKEEENEKVIDHDNNHHHGISPIQVYELKNQPAVTERVEAARQRHHYTQHMGGNGSGMQVVFLGSKKVTAGTGVFLPRVPADPTHQKNKSKSAVCPIVLMPTRVLQALELHFKRTRYQPTGGSQFLSCPKDESFQKKEGDEIQLPQEWTY